MTATNDCSTIVDTLQLFRQERVDENQTSPSDEELVVLAEKLSGNDMFVDLMKAARLNNEAVKAQMPQSRLVPTATPMIFSGYSQNTPANTTPHWSIGIIGSFYVNQDNTNLSCKCNFVGFGVAALPLGKGTLFYNNYDDLTGDCEVWVHAISLYLGVTFSRKGTAFAEYASGGVPSIGVFRGSGTWTR